MKYWLSIIATMGFSVLSACGGETEFNWCGGWEIDPSKPLIDTHQVTSRSISLHWQRGCPKGYRDNGGFISKYGYFLEAFNKSKGKFELVHASTFLSSELSVSHLLLDPNTEYLYKLYFSKDGEFHEDIATITVKTKPAGSDPPLSQNLKEKAYLFQKLGPDTPVYSDEGDYLFELNDQVAVPDDFPLVYQTQISDESLNCFIYFGPGIVRYKNNAKEETIGGIDFYWDLYKGTTKEFIGRVDSLGWSSDSAYSPYIFQGNVIFVIKFKHEIFKQVIYKVSIDGGGEYTGGTYY